MSKPVGYKDKYWYELSWKSDPGELTWIADVTRIKRFRRRLYWWRKILNLFRNRDAHYIKRDMTKFI